MAMKKRRKKEKEEEEKKIKDSEDGRWPACSTPDYFLSVAISLFLFSQLVFDFSTEGSVIS